MRAALLFEGLIDGAWQTLGVQRAGDAPATISDNCLSGRREVYVTECLADHATIRRLLGGEDIELGIARFIDSDELERAELVKRLAIGESIELQLKPDRAPARRPVRYRCVMQE